MAELYRISGPDQRQYIGATQKTGQKRLMEHFREAKTNRSPDNYFHRALRKYGPDAFSTETLVVGTIDYVFGIEEAAIQAFGTMAPGGYNTKEGGIRGRHTPESRALISASSRARMGKPGAKAAASQRTKELWADPEFRAKMMKTRTDSKRHPGRVERAERAWDDPAKRKAQGKRAKARWADPEKREQMLKQLADARASRAKAIQDDPDYRARQSDKGREVWARPGHRKKMSRALRESAAKKKQATKNKEPVS